MASREELGGQLADRRWMGRVLDRPTSSVNRARAWALPVPRRRRRPSPPSLQGPEYMRRMRKPGHRGRAYASSTTARRWSCWSTTTAPSPARPASAARRPAAGPGAAPARSSSPPAAARSSPARSAATSHRRRLLLAAEAGAELSGMEFSNAYAHRAGVLLGDQDRLLLLRDVLPRGRHGRCEGAGSAARPLGDRPYAADGARSTPGSTSAEPTLRRRCGSRSRTSSCRSTGRGIDPFTERFPVTLRLEGTVRGTGGLRIVDEECATTVPGLYAAGDAATRELICGGFTGGGSHNAAWAISSGTWAGPGRGRHAAALGARTGERRVSGAGRRRPAAHRQPGRRGAAPRGRARRAGRGAPVRQELLPHRGQARRPRGRRWTTPGAGRGRRCRRRRRARSCGREAAAMIAHARWMYTAAPGRAPETRGMHKRDDLPQLGPGPAAPAAGGGLDEVWTGVDPVAPAPQAARRRAAVVIEIVSHGALHRLRHLHPRLPDERLRPRRRTACRSSPARTTARPASCARPTARPTRCSSRPQAEPLPAGLALRDEELSSPPACSAATAEDRLGRRPRPGRAPVRRPRPAR